MLKRSGLSRIENFFYWDADHEMPVLAFSKEYHHFYNPETRFLAVMTCAQANEECPMVMGADALFSIPYDDPKVFDGGTLQIEKYRERSTQIAGEMDYVIRRVAHRV